ncbi:MAG: hypothetical protein ABIS50_26325 [Luteolibacter sp.]|uniref:hypothetical protein n=1 Tax=Luteolibacter sp. TaxID=1962973 RepID=UPI0032665EAF
MNANNTSWFHCGRCGSLFLSTAGEPGDRFCTSCGCNPSLGIDLPSPDSTDIAPLPLADPQESAAERKKPSHKKRKQSFFMLKLMTGWVVVLVAIVYGAKTLWPDDQPNITSVKSTLPAKPSVSPEDIQLLNDAAPLCLEALTGFLSAATPEERNQFVSSPVTTAARMALFYSMNPLTNVDPRNLGIQGSSILHLPNGNAVEIHLSSPDGRLFDVVFVRENDEWRIDWDHYARYSDSPWALFLAGSGEVEGEFRLLARERLADERKSEDSISVVLYAPRFGYANDTGFQSPEFIVKRDTQNGRLLDAAFKLERSAKQPFGLNLPSINPEGLIRVRVKIRRFEVNMERRFEIENVIACHWYSVDEPGMEIPDAPAKK